MPPRRLRIRTVLGFALLAAVAAIALWWISPADPVAVLRRHHAALAGVDRRFAPELGSRVERWRMITVAGDTLSALWRPALHGTADSWTVVLLGGLVSGERAALLVPDSLSHHLLAVDWPWRGPRRLAWWQIALRLGEIRRAILRSPGVLAVGVEAAGRAPETDPTRIALMGVSLGVPPAVAALRLTQRPAALVLLHGAADLDELLRHGLVREGVPGLVAAPLAALAARLVHPLEPGLHGDAIGNRPVLIINATNDPKLPDACVARLHGMVPHADVRWGPALHGSQDRRTAIAEAADSIQTWLTSVHRE